MAEGDKEVVLSDDEQQDDKAQVVTQETETEQTPIVDDIDELRRNLEAERAARAAAERRAEEATSRATSAESTAFGSQMAVIQGALDTIAANRDTLKKQIAAAMAEGDFDKATDLTDQMTTLAAQKIELDKGKAALEAQGRVASRSTPASDLVESYVKNLQPRAAEWIRAHPEYVTDKRKNDAMLAQHYGALAAGHTEGSDEYFGFIEQKLNMRGNGHAAAAEPTSAPRPEPTAHAAQVVQRRDEVQPSPAPTSRGGSPRRITLSKSEQEAADISGVSYEEYAKLRETERKAGTLVYTHNQRRH